MYRLLKYVATSNAPILKFGRRLLKSPFSYFQRKLLALHKEKDFIQLLKRINKKYDTGLWGTEMFHVYSFARSVGGGALEGEFAEVGVYEGASAEMLCEVKGEIHLHLFDTFSGLPEGDYLHAPKQFAYSLENVQRHLAGYKNVYFYKGIFPDDTSHFVKNKLFSFVHMDLDLYKSTKDALEFFYPRMVRGGVILSHDYSTLPNVRRAFTEFFVGKEIVFELSNRQCVVLRK